MPSLADLIERGDFARGLDTPSGNPLFDSAYWADVGSGAMDAINRGGVAGLVGAPVDIVNTVMRPIGLGSDSPVMGSEWIGEQMRLADIVSDKRNPIAETLAGFVDPATITPFAMKAAALGIPALAAFGATAIGSKANKGTKLSKLAQIMPKQRGIFAGVGAKTANLDNLEIAQKLKQQGVPDELIWKQTGWTLDTPDRLPRFEIPDNASKIEFPRSGEKVSSQEAYDVISHRDLQSAYPESPSLKIVNKDDPTFKGAYFDNLDGITVMQPNEGLAHSTTLHELQHAIQQREGFARGGSPEMFTQADEAKIAADALSWKRELLRKRTEMPNADWSAVENAVVHDYQKLGAMDMLPSREARDLASQPYVLHGEKMAPNDLAEVENLVKMYGLDKRTTPYKPMELYQRLAGEAEARLTQARMNMTPEERLANYPYQPEYFQQATGVPLKDLIVRKDGGTAMMIPPDVAKTLNTPLNLPADDVFARAVANTPNAQVTPEGLLMRVQRNQMPEQAMSESVRGGVFYLPEGSKQAKYYSTGKAVYGGGERIAGETLVKNPLFVKGATGGKAPETAFDLMQGKGAYQSMRNDALRSLGGYGVSSSKKAELADKFLDKYAPELSGYGAYIVENSGKANQLAYALQEAAVASAARSKGHDAVLGYSKGKQGEFISELFDVRERSYPNAHGDYDIWDGFTK